MARTAVLAVHPNPSRNPSRSAENIPTPATVVSANPDPFGPLWSHPFLPFQDPSMPSTNSLSDFVRNALSLGPQQDLTSDIVSLELLQADSIPLLVEKLENLIEECWNGGWIDSSRLIAEKRFVQYPPTGRITLGVGVEREAIQGLTTKWITNPTTARNMAMCFNDLITFTPLTPYSHIHSSSKQLLAAHLLRMVN